MSMSKKLQIVTDDEELEGFRRAAKRQGMTLSEWARQAMRRAKSGQRGPTAQEKLAALEQALVCDHPTGDIGDMLAEIERGRDLR